MAWSSTRGWCGEKSFEISLVVAQNTHTHNAPEILKNIYILHHTLTHTQSSSPSAAGECSAGGCAEMATRTNGPKLGPCYPHTHTNTLTYGPKHIVTNTQWTTGRGNSDESIDFQAPLSINKHFPTVFSWFPFLAYEIRWNIKSVAHCFEKIIKTKFGKQFQVRVCFVVDYANKYK